MKIRYFHSSNPKTEHELDTRKQQAIDEEFGRRVLGKESKVTAEEYDKYFLEKMKREKEAGRIIWYEVVEENGDGRD